MTVSINGSGGLTFNDNSVQSTAASGFGFKNRIINGAMVIDQRNAGAALTLAASGSGFPVDRMRAANQTDGTFTVQQSTVAPVGFTNSILATVTATDTSLGGIQFAQLEQRIEGFNVADLGWGTANAQTVTVSFQVRSSLTGTFCVAIYNSNGSRCYVATYTINVANTWESKTITIAGDTGGTWQTGNSTGINLIFTLAVGSTYQQAAGSWGTTSFAIGTSGQTNFLGTNGATFYITGVQLEKGSTATSFDYRPYGTELALCQRYCYQISSDNASNGGGTGLTGAATGGTTAGAARCQTSIPQMRASPTLALSNVSGVGTDLRVYDGGGVANLTALVTNFSTANAVQFDANVGSAFTVGRVLTVLWQNSINNGFIRLTAEL